MSFLTWDDGGGTASSTGAIRFPQPTNGVNNYYEAIKCRSAIGASTARDIRVLTLWENPADWLSQQFGDPENYYTVLTGGKNGYVGISTDTASGSVAGAYFIVRLDGLAALNLARGLGNPMFEVSDSMASEYAWRLEVKYDGYCIQRLGPQSLGHEFRNENEDAFWGFEGPVGGCDSHDQLLFGSNVAQAATPYRERMATKALSGNYTLGNAEIPARILNFTGTLAGPVTVTGPALPGASYFVRNSTNVALTIGAVAIAVGMGAEVFHDGSTYVRRTADV